MSAPQPPEAAVEAGARAAFEIRDDPYDDDEWEDLDSTDRELYECQSRAALAAAYPHIERAVIQRLIEKAEAPVRFDVVGPAGYGHAQDARTAARWLRAELEGGDRG